MSTFSGQVAASTDDAAQVYGGSTVTLTDFTDALSQVASGYLAFRFLNVTIPQGATISAATLSLYIASTKAIASGNCTIDCENVDNAATFGSGANALSSLSLTGSGSTWVFTAPGVTGFTTSGSFVAALQAVVNRAGWASGHALAVLVKSPDASINFAIEMYDDIPADAAKINATYTVGGATPAVPVPVTLPARGHLGLTRAESANKVEGTRFTYRVRPADAPLVLPATILRESLQRSLRSRRVSADTHHPLFRSFAERPLCY